MGRPDQTSMHQKQQNHRPARPRVSIFLEFELTDEESMAGRFNSIQAYVKVSRDMSIG